MPWCPKCRLEYREGFDKCSECDEALVDELPEEPAAEAEPSGKGEGYSFLVSVADGFEAQIIEAKLEAFGVPVMKRHKETGDYLSIYMGASPFGIDLYVPVAALEKAREILEDVPEVVEDGEEETEEEILEEREMEEASEEFKGKSRRNLYILLLLIFGLPLLAVLIYNILAGM